MIIPSLPHYLLKPPSSLNKVQIIISDVSAFVVHSVVHGSTSYMLEGKA